jgi:hypothetical protein
MRSGPHRAPAGPRRQVPIQEVSMRIALLAVGILIVLLTPATAAREEAAAATYTPPAEPGTIFTVIDAPQRGGEAEPFTVSETMGVQHRQLTVGAPYPHCRHTTPTGAVVRFRHFTADSQPMTLQTTGTIIRGPYQGSLPPEALHSCYQSVS